MAIIPKIIDKQIIENGYRVVINSGNNG